MPAADLPVAIGIATGGPTNVAARLQDFSRVFGTPIVLDETTFRRSATPCTPHHEVSIRGRSAGIDVFKPLATGSARRLGRICPRSQQRSTAHAG